jgi:IclR family acetate operon transcriptional repressor
MSRVASPASTVNKTLGLLDCFSTERPLLSVSELASMCGLPRPTVHRLLTALRANGYVTQDLVSRRYRLGYKLLELSRLVVPDTWPREAALPVMTRLRNATGDGVYLMVADQWEGIVLEQAEPAEGVRLWTRVGSRRPLHVGAAMKTILAFMPLAQVEAYIKERGLVRVGPGTITDPDRLRAELAVIRTRGYAVSIEEYRTGGLGIAAPIRNRAGTTVAAITLAMARAAVNDEQIDGLISQVVAAAREISEALGSSVFEPPVTIASKLNRPTV